MRWHSTPESVREGKPSILAILETLAAMAISLILAYHFSSVKHIAIGSCIAPLLLLSTERSSRLSLNWADYIYRKLYKLWEDSENYCVSYKFPKSLFASLVSLIVTIIFWLGTIISIFFIKILTTTLTCIKHPIYTCKEFLLNWKRNVLSTDFFTIPELIPGIEIIDRDGSKLGFFRFKNLALEYTEIHLVMGEEAAIISDIFKKHRSRPIMIIAVIFFLFPCYIYRWSLKSTALIWSPLLWVLREPYSGNLWFRLDQIRSSAIQRTIRYYSLFIIVIFSIKIYIFIALQQLIETWQKIPGIRVIIVPHEIPVWQLTAVTNAIITWVLYFAADWYLLKYRHQQPVPENLLEKVLHVLTPIRAPLTIYNIACTLYITLNSGLQMNWPPLGTKIFPWQ